MANRSIIRTKMTRKSNPYKAKDARKDHKQKRGDKRTNFVLWRDE